MTEAPEEPAAEEEQPPNGEDETPAEQAAEENREDGATTEAVGEGNATTEESDEVEEAFRTMYRLLELHDIEEKVHAERVRVALAKFNFFLVVTFWLTSSAFLLILGLLMRRTLPYVLIIIGVSVLGLVIAAVRIFRPRKKQIEVPDAPAPEGEASPGSADQPPDEQPDEGEQ